MKTSTWIHEKQNRFQFLYAKPDRKCLERLFENAPEATCTSRRFFIFSVPVSLRETVERDARVYIKFIPEQNKEIS